MADNPLMEVFNVLGKIQEIKKTNLEIKALKKSET
jgi:hypothetical protein